MLFPGLPSSQKTFLLKAAISVKFWQHCTFSFDHAVFSRCKTRALSPPLTAQPDAPNAIQTIHTRNTIFISRSNILQNPIWCFVFYVNPKRPQRWLEFSQAIINHHHHHLGLCHSHCRGTGPRCGAFGPRVQWETNTTPQITHDQHTHIAEVLLARL